LGRAVRDRPRDWSKSDWTAMCA